MICYSRSSGRRGKLRLLRRLIPIRRARANSTSKLAARHTWSGSINYSPSVQLPATGPAAPLRHSRWLRLDSCYLFLPVFVIATNAYATRFSAYTRDGPAWFANYNSYFDIVRVYLSIFLSQLERTHFVRIGLWRRRRSRKAPGIRSRADGIPGSRVRARMHECVRGDDRVAWRSANNTYNGSPTVVCAREFVPINARVHTGCNLSMYTRVILSNEARVHARVRAFGDVKSARALRDRLGLGTSWDIRGTRKTDS